MWFLYHISFVPSCPQSPLGFPRSTLSPPRLSTPARSPCCYFFRPATFTVDSTWGSRCSTTPSIRSYLMLLLYLSFVSQYILDIYGIFNGLIVLLSSLSRWVSDARVPCWLCFVQVFLASLFPARFSLASYFIRLTPPPRPQRPAFFVVLLLPWLGAFTLSSSLLAFGVHASSPYLTPMSPCFFPSLPVRSHLAPPYLAGTPRLVFPRSLAFPSRVPLVVLNRGLPSSTPSRFMWPTPHVHVRLGSVPVLATESFWSSRLDEVVLFYAPFLCLLCHHHLEA